MKVRSIAIIDYDMQNGFLDAREEEVKLTMAVSKIVNSNKYVTHHQFQIKPTQD